ncbi:MAG: twin-arginine translocase TatA/TatE family subunit [Acidobacteriota bacterium]
MFGQIGLPEMMIIMVIALLIFGPKKLPSLGKSLGEGIVSFKKAFSGQASDEKDSQEAKPGESSSSSSN